MTHQNWLMALGMIETVHFTHPTNYYVLGACQSNINWTIDYYNQMSQYFVQGKWKTK